MMLISERNVRYETQPRLAERHGREERQRESQEAVGPHLEQNPRQDHGPRRGRLDVRIGEPGVQREERHLDREREEEGREQPPGHGAKLTDLAQHVRVRERVRACGLARVQIQHEDRHQHQQRAEERIDEELDRRVQPVVPAPDPDDEVHRNQHHFPHHIEEEEIERHEDADHARCQHEQQRVEATLALGDVAPASQNRERHEEGGEQDEEQRDPVHADRVVNAPRGDPGSIDGELHAAVRNKCPPERDRNREFD